MPFSQAIGRPAVCSFSIRRQVKTVWIIASRTTVFSAHTGADVRSIWSVPTPVAGPGSISRIALDGTNNPQLPWRCQQ